MVLSASDLGAPPLIPMVLQRQDKANLTQYFKSLWSVAADSKNQFLIYVSDVMDGWRKRLDHVLKSLCRAFRLLSKFGSNCDTFDSRRS